LTRAIEHRFPRWLAVSLRTLGILFVLGIATASASEPTSAVEVAEVVEDLEPDNAVVVTAAPSSRPDPRPAPSGFLATAHQIYATQPPVPPPRA
jgi:hypothetical protein